MTVDNPILDTARVRRPSRTGPTPTIATVAGSETPAARASMRAQIARLERQLALNFVERVGPLPRHSPLPTIKGHPPTAYGASRGGRLLGLAELEQVRDHLAWRLRESDLALAKDSEAQESARQRLESMLADPSRHRFEVMPLAALGQSGCGAYQVRPRFGLLGMLFDWWCVKLSSGCPLAMARRYYYRRPREPRPGNRNLELVVSVVVIVAVTVFLVVFLVVFHDFPLRVSGP